MTGTGSDPRTERDAAAEAAALDEALAALAAAAPPPLSEDFLRRVSLDAIRARDGRSRPAPIPLRADRRAAPRTAPGGLRARIAAGAVAMAASALLGFFAGWTDLAGVSAPGFADDDLLADEIALVADWEDAL